MKSMRHCVSAGDTRARRVVSAACVLLSVAFCAACRTGCPPSYGPLSARPHFPLPSPGDIVGIEDHFYNYLIYQLTLTVFAPVVESGSNKIQPTYVLDVADAVAALLRKPDTAGKTLYLGGPEVLT